ncbi:hypothetical protein JHK82_049867 [Glycine max]|uniref:Prolamin-like domain-containing protein n=1 Tax=Glycine soja TaxID=3848 RepID=A0A445FRD9_GLYSO|nr:egg cell-secreted protein 1.1 [Glycine max]XP_028214884.1 egg cell-secreted protein 1.1-like [Glycine soja]KAG4920926.1 hypothetical protein JHK86_049739 [Glycine max]KAG4935574.1 hypothetical protein JHK85_050493 [Glycine max]KAG5091089.1 hypothetical protein JHK82_049867 [Glycine max]KAG5094189.1 hypothetical protein JHK84_049777 [Glycine max]KAH1197520.1 Egg cell-secreted protein 1.1 [Glycine max]|eukprot:XP_006603209.1 egg cell-secreted protein 1.1 [Glycine max]
MASSYDPVILVTLVITALVSHARVVESRSLSNLSTTLSLAVRLKLEGQGCRQAIRVIGHDCWHNIVASLGFTTEETDILEGYCDEIVHSPPPPLVEP